MELKHTPAPWRVNEAHDSLSEFAICADIFGHGFGSSVAVATQRDSSINPISREQAAANARLIAAAPEMLEALQHIMDRHSKHFDNFEFEYIHKIISKAKGESK